MAVGLLSSSLVEGACGVGVVVAAALAVRRIEPKSVLGKGFWTLVNVAERVLVARSAPVFVGALSAIVVWWVWGSLQQVAVFHDERAYVMQALIFAGRHWAAAPPPLKEFFQQFHVLDIGGVAAKYPPGHALMITPGAWLDLPGLIPVLLSGVAGSLVFALPRRLAGPWVGLLSWWLWISEARNLTWRASYFSEVTTSAIWLLSWWLLVEWRTTRKWPLLVALGAVVGWGAITRPLTTLVLVVPIAVVVLTDVARDRRWISLGAALAVGCGVLGLVPLWSANTTGDWKETPLTLYTRTYIPWDHPGFGLDPTAPQRTLRPDLLQVDSVFEALNRQHTVRALPRIAVERLRAIATDTDHDWRKALLVFAVVGLCVLSGEGYFVALTSLLLVLAYLCYVQSPGWTVYYLETVPVLSWLAAWGCWWTLERFVPGAIAGKETQRAVPRAAGALLLIAIATMPFVGAEMLGARRSIRAHTAYHRAFRDRIANLRDSRALIFVRYAPGHDPNASLVGFPPDPTTAPVWIVYDRGDTNATLIDAAPDRAGYLFDEARDTLIAIRR